MVPGQGEEFMDGNITWRDKGRDAHADDNVHFYSLNGSSRILDTSKQSSVILPKAEMDYTEMEYGFRMFMDCLEKDIVPEATLEDNIKSFAMVAASQESSDTGKTVKCRLPE